jgi:hypothetical protein
VTPPEITRLEMDAAIAKELATAATARASIASLEHQRSLLGGPASFSAPPASRSGFPWLVIAAVVLFVAWAVATDPHRARHDHFGTTHYTDD